MRSISPAALAVIASLSAACAGPGDRVNPRPDRAMPLPPASALAAAGAPDLACHAEGEDFWPGDAGGACCDGLAPALVYKGSMLRLDDCVPAGGDLHRCIRCGDDRCGVGEDSCNCPHDCHFP
jgi:hypothetical protein